jgi:hypothetical protein
VHTVTADGILRHHFWGEYRATIGLRFASSAHARDALPVLGSGWAPGNQNAAVLVWHGASAELDTVSDLLASYGANRDKIASCATSIDYGEPFSVTIPIVPAEQLALRLG